jgi:branched-chain amino acid transport system ATP-binding protein
MTPGGSDDDAGADGPASDLLAVDDLTVRFGGVTAASGVSLHVRSGESCVLIGPNGAGKTTVFDAIAGQNVPASGRIAYQGTDITGKSALWRARHGIRRTFQRQQTFPGLTVEDNVLVALEWDKPHPVADILGLPQRRRTERTRRAEAEEVLDRLGLYGVRKEPAYRLPLGRARLLELARVIAAKPRLVLLDEPTSGMEDADIARLSATLDQLTSEHQCGILLVEHAVDFAMRHAQRVYAMHLGEVIAEGTPDQVQANERVIQVYLGGLQPDISAERIQP